MTISATLPRRMIAFTQRLRRNTSGLAMTEFALSLPILISLSFVGVETANLALAHLRASQIALMVADNAGRVRRSIDATDINEIMVGARLAGEGIKLGEQGRIILSSIEPNGQPAPNSGQTITWQRCFGLKNYDSTFGNVDDGKLDSSRVAGFGPNGRKIAAVNGSAVMFVELFYDYEPLVGEAFIDKRTIHYTAAYTVRERLPAVPTNVKNLNDAQQRLCSVRSAT